MYKHLDAREWLEREYLDGNEFAIELLELVDGEDAAIANAEALAELYGTTKLKSDGELWRLIEWIRDRLRLLEAIETLVEENTQGLENPNGTPFTDCEDRLAAAFQSPRWQQYDL